MDKQASKDGQGAGKDGQSGKDGGGGAATITIPPIAPPPGVKKTAKETAPEPSAPAPVIKGPTVVAVEQAPKVTETKPPGEGAGEGDGEGLRCRGAVG